MRNMLQIAPALTASALITARAAEVGQWEIFETSFETTKQYATAFTDVEVNVTFPQVWVLVMERVRR